MYFSNFNKNITYSTVWGGELTVEGQGAVKKEDTNVSPGSLKDLQKYHIIRLDNGITSVGPGFLETFGNMQGLIICRSVKSIAMTPALSALLQRNRVLVRGWKNTLADRFAADNGLPFLQADILIGWSGLDAHYTNTKLTLRFREKGNPFLEFDDYCPGISAGNNGGGTYTRELDKGALNGMTLQSFADRLPRFQEPILKNQDLNWFLKNL